MLGRWQAQGIAAELSSSKDANFSIADNTWLAERLLLRTLGDLKQSCHQAVNRAISCALWAKRPCALTGPSSPAGVISTPPFSKFNPQISQASSAFPLLLPQASCWAQLEPGLAVFAHQRLAVAQGEVVPSLSRALTPKVGQSAFLPKS